MPPAKVDLGIEPYLIATPASWVAALTPLKGF
jgi:hypothetical protein